jgi:hydrogenase maturation protease
MLPRASSPVCLIACCGHPAAGDDALGPLVARALRDLGLPEGVELVDLGANPARLLDHLDDRTALILVDAIVCEGRAPGELIDVAWPEALSALTLGSSSPSTTHGLGVAEQLTLVEQLGMRPRAVRVVGLTIDQAAIGTDVSDAVRDRLPALVDRVRLACREMMAVSP